NLICFVSSCRRQTCTTYRSFVKRLGGPPDQLYIGPLAAFVANLDHLAGVSTVSIRVCEDGAIFSSLGVIGTHPMSTRCSGSSARYGHCFKRGGSRIALSSPHRMFPTQLRRWRLKKLRCAATSRTLKDCSLLVD